MSYEPKFKIVSQLFGYCEDGQTAYEILRKIQEIDPDVVGVGLIEQVIEHNIALQKKDVELISNINKLVQRIDKLISIFEEASKHVAEVGDDKKIIELADKLEELLNQNKNLAKGLVMLEQYVRTKSQFESPMQRRI